MNKMMLLALMLSMDDDDTIKKQIAKAGFTGYLIGKGLDPKKISEDEELADKYVKEFNETTENLYKKQEKK